MVVFAGMEFIFRFFPVFILVFYVVPVRFRETVLLAGSIIFYTIGELRFLPVLLIGTGLNYVLGRWNEKRYLLITAIIFDVLLLAVFKGMSVFVSGSLLPLGISFYLFKMIAYQMDLYNGKITETVTFHNAALYFCMFPQVISGPIMRYQEGRFGLPRNFSLVQIEDGLKYCIIGFGMKVLLADRLAVFWSDMQMIGFASISTMLAWLGAFVFSLRLYFDFWGYSLMAAGIGMMVGFPFIRNFNHPYAARSIGEFYRRWHMTLGSWFRDYVYIPMGGSRVGLGRLVLNLLVVWTLTGIWHGSGINFVLWGLILGVLIVAEKLLSDKVPVRIPWLGNLYVLLVIPLTWVVFALSDLNQLGLYFSRLFPFGGPSQGHINPHDFMNYLRSYGALIVIGIILCIPWVTDWYRKHKKNPLVTAVLVVVFWLGVYSLAGRSGNPFMYFKF